MGDESDGFSSLFYTLLDNGSEKRGRVSQNIFAPVVVKLDFGSACPVRDYASVVIQSLINGNARNVLDNACGHSRRIE